MRSTPLAPVLLVAMDTIVDPNFRRTVVLMLHHDETEAFGLVLNRELDVTASTLCASIDLAWAGDPDARVDWGGPVQPDHGWVLLGEGIYDDEEVEEVTRGIRFSRSQAVLREVAESQPPHLRLFLGYAGWGGGQLEREIAEGSWLVVPVAERLVFETHPEHLWAATVRSLGIEPATLVASQGVN